MEQSKQDVLFSHLLTKLNAAVFRHMDEDIFQLEGKAPAWLHDFIDEKTLSSEIKLGEYYPFLEIFIPGLYDLDEDTQYSDVWTETGQENKEKYLQAVGVKYQDQLYLLIISHEGSLYHDRELLQKGRENELSKEKITKAKEELERLLKFKDQFVSIVSHDLRSPVSSVVSITNMMLADDEFREIIGEVYLDFVESMNKDMQLLLEYNEKLYHWSNLQLGKFNLELKKVRLKSLINSTKNRFFEKAKEKNIKIEIDIEDDFEFEADESLFTQVLTNLVGNAIKFTPPDGQIKLHSKLKENKIMIQIADSGVGIKPDIARNLFSGYVKEHMSGTNGEKGTGLGLGIVKRILDAHGFRIDVKSELNKGTEFYIIIPPEK